MNWQQSQRGAAILGDVTLAFHHLQGFQWNRLWLLPLHLLPEGLDLSLRGAPGNGDVRRGSSRGGTLPLASHKGDLPPICPSQDGTRLGAVSSENIMKKN